MAEPMETEVCIIGAGAAGGIMAFELARAGIEVVVLESGPRHDFSKRFVYVQNFLRGDNPWEHPVRELDRHTTSGKPGYNLDWNRARGVGGSTLHWEGYTPRFHANDFRTQTVYGVGRDWPIGYDEIEPYYLQAENALGVAGASGDLAAPARSGPSPLPAFEPSYTDAIFAKACGSLGISFTRLPQARNSVPYGGRAQCAACGTCYVCPTGAKATTELTHVPQAEATGKARVITNATVLRLETDGAKRVVEVLWGGMDHAEHRLRARIFILAAGAVETPRLLLLSRSSAYPNGLANRSGLVGKGFMTHPVVEMIGRVKENVFPFRMGFSTSMSRQFGVERNLRGANAFALEFLNNAGLTPDWLGIVSGKTGKDLRKHIEREFGRTMGIRIYCEQLPDEENSVSLNAKVKDYFGKPVPHLTYSTGEPEWRTMAAGREVATKILRAAGATAIRQNWSINAAHQIGTVRMGTDPETSVVDKDLLTHDLENLYLVGSGSFPTATCNHPTLTLCALTIRAAGHVRARLAALR